MRNQEGMLIFILFKFSVALPLCPEPGKVWCLCWCLSCDQLPENFNSLTHKLSPLALAKGGSEINFGYAYYKFVSHLTI